MEIIELHGFGDASFSAYGCCVYLKYVKRSGNIMVSLIAAKSRVAPMKSKQSIPRLELLGSLITSRLISSVSKCFEGDLSISKICCYTDSQVCLAWIQALDKEFKTFVQNRLIEIRPNVKPCNWFYCSTKQNPADVITRVNKNNLSNEIWLNGPPFLYDRDSCHSRPKDVPYLIGNFENEIKLPKFLRKQQKDWSEVLEKDDQMVKVSTENPNVNNECILLTCEKDLNMDLSLMFHVNKYRDLLKLFRVTVYVFRFISVLRGKGESIPTHSRYCTADEMKKARKFWIKENQRLFKEGPDFKQLSVQMSIIEDDEGIMRARGRMQYSCLPYEMKTPIVLKKDHYLANLIVWHCHSKVLHNGVKQTVTEIRSCYWIGKTRQFVKKLLHRCFVCRRLNARPYSYPGHSDLPAFRFDESSAFNSTGVDYLGPLMVLHVCKTQEKLHKVPEAHTFVNSFKRFIARRGAPSLMVSDNGSMFTAAETQAFATSKEINWKFNLDHAANSKLNFQLISVQKVY